MIIIHMLDGEKIEILEDTVLAGINNLPRSSESGKGTFYLEKKYKGNLQGDFEKEGSALSTSDERLGIAGFLLSHDAFSLDDGPGQTIYFTSAVKCITEV